MSTDLLDCLFDLVILKCHEKESDNREYIEKILNENEQLELHISTKNKLSLLACVCDTLNLPIIELLFKRQKSNIYNVSNNTKNSILHHIILNHKSDDCLQFIDLNTFDFNYQNMFKSTVFHYAVCYNLLIFRKLIEHPMVTKEHLNIVNNYKHTCISHLVQKTEYLPLLKLCIDKGFNIFQKDLQDQNILDLAKLYNVKEIMDYLVPLFEQQINTDNNVNSPNNLINNSSLRLFDTVEVTEYKKSGIVVFTDPSLNFISVVLNNPKTEDEMTIHNILKSNIKKIEKPTLMSPGDFISHPELLKLGMVVMNQKRKKLVVTKITDNFVTLTTADIERITYCIQFQVNVPSSFLFWMAV